MVFDDSSDDKTFDVMMALKREYSSLDISITGSIYARSGVCFARNFMIGRISNGLIICLDADDTLHDISPLIAAYEPNTWVYGDHNEVDHSQIRRHKGAPVGSLARKMITGVTFLFHKDDWQRVGGFDPDFAYCEDYGLQCALTHAGVQPRYVDTVVYDRYVHPEGNERSTLAGQYWTFYRDMARRKYPSVFAGTG